MFILKTKYFLIIENIKEIDLSKIKKHDKFIIIIVQTHLKINLMSNNI